MQQLAKQWKLDDSVMSVPELLEAPWMLIGSEDRIVDDLHAHRERFGFSYFTIHEAQYINTFAPIVARLTGT